MKAEALKNKPDLVRVPSEDFRRALRELAGAICVITVGEGEKMTGFVATSVTSFSADPPVIIVCVDNSSSSWGILRDAGRFGVNFMREQDWQIADRFAGFGGIKGKDRYQGAQWTVLDSGTLVLTDALATVACLVEETIERHDHIIVLGRVEELRCCNFSKPLLWFRSKYHFIGEALSATGS